MKNIAGKDEYTALRAELNETVADLNAVVAAADASFAALESAAVANAAKGVLGMAGNKRVVFVANALLCFVIILVLVFGLIFASSGGRAPFRVLGFSAVSMVTDSMQNDIPQGSLVITRRVAAGRLKIGDDIAFFMAPGFVVVHRIIDINNGFVTQGTSNAVPDREIVPYANIVGRVVFKSKALGAVQATVDQNSFFSIVFGILVIGFFVVLRKYLVRGRVFWSR